MLMYSYAFARHSESLCARDQEAICVRSANMEAHRPLTRSVSGRVQVSAINLTSSVLQSCQSSHKAEFQQRTHTCDQSMPSPLTIRQQARLVKF